MVVTPLARPDTNRRFAPPDQSLIVSRAGRSFWTQKQNPEHPAAAIAVFDSAKGNPCASVREAAPRSHQYDLRMVTSGRGQTPVPGQQLGIERFGESDINRVIRGKIMSQRPDARQQEIVLVSVQG